MIEYVNVLTTELKSAKLLNKIVSHELNQIVNEHKFTENLDTSEKLKYQMKTYAGSQSRPHSRSEQ
jgi:hypothetical protein